MPLNERRTRLTHELHIEWKSELAEQEEIVVVADEAAPPEPPPPVFHGRFQMLRAQEVRLLEEKKEEAQAPPSPVGRTWAEWQRELLRSR